MPEYKISVKQREALDHIGTAAKVDYQKPDGTIVVSAGKYGFTISPTGTVEEITSDIYKKPEKKSVPQLPTPVKEKHAMTQQQIDLMAKHGIKDAKYWIERDMVVKLYGEDWVFGYDGISLSKKDYDKKFGKTVSTSPSFTYSYKTVCQENPERCKPRQIEHVAFDADHTIWTLKTGIAGSVTGPLKKIDDDTVIELSGKSEVKKSSKAFEHLKQAGFKYDKGISDEEAMWAREMEGVGEIADELVGGLSQNDKEFLAGLSSGVDYTALPPPPVPTTSEPHEINRITLLPTFRQTLDELEKRGIKSTIISLNTPGSVKRLLKAFGLDKRFVEIRDSYENKGKVFEEINRKHNFCACKSIFVDDTKSNVQDVAKECGLGLVIGAGKDVEKPIDIFKFIKDS